MLELGYSTPTLSIITVAWNNLEGLKRTVASVLEQEGPSEALDYVIVDGGSTDGTLEYLKSLDPKIRWFSAPDRGVYDAMNKGMRFARGDYQLYLNAGDILHLPSSFQSIVGALGDRPLWLVARAIDASRTPPQAIPNIPHSWVRHAMGRQPHSHQSSVFSSEMMRLFGGYADTFSFIADFDLILRFGLISPPAELDVVVAEYEGGGMSARRGAEIPKLQARVRAARMQLGKRLATANSLYANLLTARRHQQSWVRSHRNRS